MTETGNSLKYTWKAALESCFQWLGCIWIPLLEMEFRCSLITTNSSLAQLFMCIGDWFLFLSLNVTYLACQFHLHWEDITLQVYEGLGRYSLMTKNRSVSQLWRWAVSTQLTWGKSGCSVFRRRKLFALQMSSIAGKTDGFSYMQKLNLYKTNQSWSGQQKLYNSYSSKCLDENVSWLYVVNPAKAVPVWKMWIIFRLQLHCTAALDHMSTVCQKVCPFAFKNSNTCTVHYHITLTSHSYSSTDHLYKPPVKYFSKQFAWLRNTGHCDNQNKNESCLSRAKWATIYY